MNLTFLALELLCKNNEFPLKTFEPWRVKDGSMCEDSPTQERRGGEIYNRKNRTLVLLELFTLDRALSSPLDTQRTRHIPTVHKCLANFHSQTCK
jgi:hypothetical protein